MDKDMLYDSVIKMGKDIRYMRDDISDLKKDFEDMRDAHNERISSVEKIQNLNTGKLGVIMTFIGVGILGIVQFAIWSWDKIAK